MGRRRGGRTEEFAGLSLLDLIRDLVLLLLDGELMISHKSNLTNSAASSERREEERKEREGRRVPTSELEVRRRRDLFGKLGARMYRNEQVGSSKIESEEGSALTKERKGEARTMGREGKS